MCALERGRVVCAVACHCHHLIVGLQSLDKAFLVHGAGTGDDLQVAHAILKPGVGDLGEFRTCDYIAFTVDGIIPETDLTPDLLGSSGGIAGDNLDLYACVDNLSDGCRHVGSNGIGDSHNAEECEVFGHYPALFYRPVTIFHFLICESECAHRLILIFEQLRINLLFCHSGSVAAHAEDNLGCTLDI